MDQTAGIDLHCTDGDNLPPKKTELEGRELVDWFFSAPEIEEQINIRLMSFYMGRPLGRIHDGFRILFEPNVVNHAIWKPEVYYSMAANPGGGAAALTDDDPRFVLQTPLDGGPFCSFALSKRYSVVKGVFTYDDKAFDPAVTWAGESSMSGWRSRGFQIINVPQSFLRAHSGYISSRLGKLEARISDVEDMLAGTEMGDFASLSRALHEFSRELVFLQRRSNFEQTVVSAIESFASHSRDGKLPWPPIATQKSVLESRKYDLQSLPLRIENARTTISSLIQQHNERMNLQIAEASRRMMEIALKDSASMKTIAIMTMVFLPGTAVASFFSMQMFDWSESSEVVSSHWLWVYFVVAIPLTCIVVAVWWLRAQRMSKAKLRNYRDESEIPLALFETAGASPSPDATKFGQMILDSEKTK